MTNEIEVYKVVNGEVVFDMDNGSETLWATENQISMLFSVDRSVINRHLRNIYREGELEEKRFPYLGYQSSPSLCSGWCGCKRAQIKRIRQ